MPQSTDDAVNDTAVPDQRDTPDLPPEHGAEVIDEPAPEANVDEGPATPARAWHRQAGEGRVEIRVTTLGDYDSHEIAEFCRAIEDDPRRLRQHLEMYANHVLVDLRAAHFNDRSATQLVIDYITAND